MGFFFYDIANFAHAFEWLTFWIGERPIVIDALYALNVAAHSDDSRGALRSGRVQKLWPCLRDIDAVLGHYGNDAGIRRIGCDRARGTYFDGVPGEVAQVGLGHLTSSRVVPADE